MSLYLVTYTKLEIKETRRPFKIFNNLETCYEHIKNYFGITTDEHLMNINLIKSELRIKKKSTQLVDRILFCKLELRPVNQVPRENTLQ